MPRFLHTADWQIGRQYARFAPEDAVALAEARFIAVERLARLADEERVDAVLVAGDIFDAQTLSERTLHRTFQALASFSGPWIMLPGNHDAALAESVWTRARRIAAIPDKVHLLLAPEVSLFEELGVAILPAPLTQRQTHRDLTAWFDTAETPPGLLRIGLAHGRVEGQLAEGIDAANPIATNRAASAGLDYLALGDWHGLKRIDERTWYSGTPEQERFKNNAAGQALLVTLDTPGVMPEVEARPIGQHGWYAWRRRLSVASDLDALLAELEALPPMSVLDLTLEGQLDLAGQQRLEQALGAAAGRQRSLQVETSGLGLVPTAEDIAALHADGYLGHVIAELQRRQEVESEREVAREALGILAGMLGARPSQQREEPQG
ncbi:MULTISPECIES: metallophosphoesterase family protein [Halomonas]|uniref:DNA repair exonuclease SbcCD nuclease subunit n=1 Tax=Halomonas ventosae TaxID=229007 RepID=A0A4R6GTA7_9GAMM|nr:DNA repair exonuclease [Halomonas ventosae]TDN97835.1 DNA repair exonuclease SbcCD nuclease subunit [Halomonas ventosae]